MTPGLAFTPTRSPPTRRGWITADQLQQAGWALSRQGSPTRALRAESFAKMGMQEPNPVVETSDLALLRGTLLETDRLTAISTQQVCHEVHSGQITVLNFELAYTHRDIGITTRQHSIPSPVAKIMCEEVRRQVKYLDGVSLASQPLPA